MNCWASEQSGLPQFRFGNLTEDLDLIRQARELVAQTSGRFSQKNLKIVLAAHKDFGVVEPRMKKLVYLVAAFGLLYIGLLAGCQKHGGYHDRRRKCRPPTRPPPTRPRNNCVGRFVARRRGKGA